MTGKIEPSWQAVLQDEFEKDYFKRLIEFVKVEYQKYTCYPPRDKIFSALAHTPFSKVKLVIIGQDPYHGPGQAHGLCFSVPEGISPPPSLINIFKELEADVRNPIPASGSLEHWADQGVLLLNATLTVRAHEAGSHQNKGWEEFTDAVIAKLSDNREGLVFLLWGGYAKKKGAKIDTHKHLVLTSGHPSPLSANRGLWFGNSHFSTANRYLREKNKREIVW